MCNGAEASQNDYLVLIVYHYPCLKRSDQSYISNFYKNIESLSLNVILHRGADALATVAWVMLLPWHWILLHHPEYPDGPASHDFLQVQPFPSPASR